MALHLLRGPFTGDALREDDRVELVAGQVALMTPIGGRHASCVRRLTRQPDLALLKPRADEILG